MQNYVVYSPLYLLIYLFNSVPVLLEVQMFFFCSENQAIRGQPIDFGLTHSEDRSRKRGRQRLRDTEHPSLIIWLHDLR